MVNAPVVTALATALPDKDPINALESTETFAGPPELLPNTRRAKSMMNCVAPDSSRKAPKITNKKTYLNITLAAGPNTPRLCRKVVLAIPCQSWPRCGSIQSGKMGNSNSKLA